MNSIKTRTKKRVFVGISGGVDSAVSALLLKEAGYEVTGVYMKLWREKGSELEKRLKQEEEGARRVAKEAGVAFKVFDLRREFKKEIVDYFVGEYVSGRTPNPCVKCNREIKFGLFFKKSIDLGADFVSTGHYVKIRKNSIGAYVLAKSKDLNKDQSYFLYNLKQGQLGKIIFPLGLYTKEEVRKIALEKNLSVHNKQESQEVCFVADKYYGDFLKRQKIDLKEGDIINKSGEVLGKHQGLPLYTLGQRRDIRIGGTGPYYVVGIDYKKNVLVVSGSCDDTDILTKKFSLKEVNWISGKMPESPIRAKVRTRYRMESVPAIISVENKKICVELNKKSRAVVSGQSAVFYVRGEVLGGGIIDKIIE